MQHPSHDSSHRLSSFLVNKAPNVGKNHRHGTNSNIEEDSLYQFGSVAWEHSHQKHQGRRSSIDMISPQSRKNKNHSSPVSSLSKTKRKTNKLNLLPKEQQEIANEIRDFLHKEKTSRSESSFSQLDAHFAKNNKNTANNSKLQPKGTPTVNQKQRSRSRPKKSSTANAVECTAPSTTFPSKQKRDMRRSSLTFSTRSQRSLPLTSTAAGFVSPYSSRSSRTLPVPLDCPKVNPAMERNTESFSLDFSSPLSFEEDDPCPKSYFSENDAEASSLEDSFLISDCDNASDNENEDGNDTHNLLASHGSWSSSFSWNLFRNQRRRHHFRVPSPEPGNSSSDEDDNEDNDDVANLLGGSLPGMFQGT